MIKDRWFLLILSISLLGCLVAALSLTTSCSGITIDTDKIKAEYDAGYAAGYAKGFADGVASCNKTLDIITKERNE